MNPDPISWTVGEEPRRSKINEVDFIFLYLKWSVSGRFCGVNRIIRVQILSSNGNGLLRGLYSAHVESTRPVSHSLVGDADNIRGKESNLNHLSHETVENLNVRFNPAERLESVQVGHDDQVSFATTDDGSRNDVFARR